MIHLSAFSSLSTTFLAAALLACAISSPASGRAQAPPAAPVHSPPAAYDQTFRPQVHFSPLQHWTNDPNGLVYYHGEYHLFFQYNPYGDTWGHMSWGHAVSTDLLHWHELPLALAEQNGVMIYTGSIVVDRGNTSGLCTGGKECLVAIYTGAGKTAEGERQTQNLAASQDDGRTWTKYAANPVLDLHMADFRDPSVFWDQAGKHWVMAVSLPKEHKVRFYASPDLKDWTQLSEFGPAGDVDGDWECPDLLQIPASKGKESLWALKVGLNPGAPQGGSGEQYFLGSFDGKSFTASTEPGAHGLTNYGKDDYCAISYNGLPSGHRPVLIGWMNNWQYAAKLPTSPWRGQMSVARELSFTRGAAGLALEQQPVIAPLRGESLTLSTILGGGSSGKAVELTAPFEAMLQFGRPKEPVFGVRIYSDEQHWTEIGFDTGKQVFYIDRTRAGVTVAAEFPARTEAPLRRGAPYDVHLIVDRSSVEAFAQDGTIAMTDLIYPSNPGSTIRVFPAEAKDLAPTGRVWKLSSAWNP